MAAATLPSENVTFLNDLAPQVAVGKVTGKTATRLRVLSANYRGVEGHGRVQASVVGRWADTCARLPGGSTLEHLKDPVERALATVYEGCARWTPTVKMNPRQYLPCKVPTFLLISDRDTVVSPAIQKEWQPALCAGVRTVENGEHFDKSADVLSEAAEWIVAAEARG